MTTIYPPSLPAVKRAPILYELKPEEIELCKDWGEKRLKFAQEMGAEQRFGDPILDPLMMEIYGVHGERRACEYLGIEWDPEAFFLKKRGKELPDGIAGGTPIDAKHTHHEDGHLTLYEAKPKHWAYWLVTGYIPRLTLEGFLMGYEGEPFPIEKWHDKRAAARWIPRDQLWSPEQFWLCPARLCLPRRGRL